MQIRELIGYLCADDFLGCCIRDKYSQWDQDCRKRIFCLNRIAYDTIA